MPSVLTAWAGARGKTIADQYVLVRPIREADASATFWVEPAGGGERSVAQLMRVEAGAYWGRAERLAHPHLARIMAGGRTEWEGTPYRFRVFERPDALLADVLEQRALSVAEAEQVLRGVLPCLAYLHSQGWVHGAIGPESVLAAGEEIKLTADTLLPAADTAAQQADVRAVGALLTAMCTGPGSREAARMPRRLRELAEACSAAGAGRRFTAVQALAQFRGQARPPGQPVAKRAYTVILVLMLAMWGLLWLNWPDSAGTRGRTAPVRQDRPNPVPPLEPQRPQPATMEPDARPDWLQVRA